MVIQARSKSPLGPWENAPNNPILRAQSKEEQWWSTGHATIFDDVHGNWYMLFHAYEKGFYTMGRQTMIVPIEWTEDDWYRIPDDISITKPIQLPNLENKLKESYRLTDSFDGDTLKPTWKFFKGATHDLYSIQDGTLSIKGKGNSIVESSPLLTVPTHHSYMADVELEIEGNAIGGLGLFYSEKISSGILADAENVLANLRGWQFITEEKVLKRNVFLRLKNIHHTVDMFFSLDGDNWTKIENSFEASAYHHNVLSDFLSLRIGLVSMGEGTVLFKNFKYQPID